MEYNASVEVFKCRSVEDRASMKVLLTRGRCGPPRGGP